MKKKIILMLAFLFCKQLSAQQGVAVNSDGTAPHSSAILDVKSTSKGMLVPRILLLSPTDVVTVPAPTNSLLVYNTNTNKAQMPDGEGFYYWDFVLLGVSSWKPVSTTPTKISAFSPPGCHGLLTATTTYQKIFDLGTFIKSNRNTFIELTLQTVLYVSSFNLSNGVAYELRVDDVATTIGNAIGLVRSPGMYYPISLTGVFEGLATGTHTISLWAHTLSGTATNAGYDPGCVGNTSVVLIKEFK